MNESEWASRVQLALDGLVPIAWLERTQRCNDPNNPTPEEMMPSEAERQQIVETLCMADVIAVPCGGLSAKERKRRGSILAALAKAMVIGACVPGGIKFLGRKWELRGGRLHESVVYSELVKSPPYERRRFGPTSGFK